MIRTIFITFVLMLIWAVLVKGQEVITLEQCRQMALEHSENLKIAALQKGVARQQQAAARTLRLPAFYGSGTILYQEKDFEMEMFLPTQVPNIHTGQLEPNIMINPLTGQPVIGPDGDPVFNMYAWLPLEVSLNGAYLLGLNLEQPIYTGGKIAAGNTMADIGLNMAEGNLTLQRMNTVLTADQAYWGYVGLIQKVKLAEKVVEMLGEMQQKVQNSVEVGLASRNDLQKIKVEYNSAKLNLQKARNGFELSRMELNRVVGLPFDTPLLVADTLVRDIEPEIPAFEEFNPRQRPEYQMLENSVKMSEQNIRMARSEYLPTVGIQAAYNHIGGIEVSGTGLDNTSFSVTGSVKIPIFQWGQGGRKIRAAQMEREMQILEFDKNKKLMQLEAEQARLNLILSHERIQMSKVALQQAGENLRVSGDNYELGMETITELLKAQALWQQAYTELIDAGADFRMKETAWLKATGGLLE